MDEIKKKIQKNSLFTTFCSNQYNDAQNKLQEVNSLLRNIEDKLEEAKVELELALQHAASYMTTTQLCPRRLNNFNIAISMKTHQVDKTEEELKQAKNDSDLARDGFLKKKLQLEIFSNKKELLKMKLKTELLSIQDKSTSELYAVRKGRRKCL